MMSGSVRSPTGMLPPPSCATPPACLSAVHAGRAPTLQNVKSSHKILQQPRAPAARPWPAPGPVGAGRAGLQRKVHAARAVEDAHVRAGAPQRDVQLAVAADLLRRVRLVREEGRDASG